MIAFSKIGIMIMALSLFFLIEPTKAQCPIPDINSVISFCTEDNDLGITFPADSSSNEVEGFPKENGGHPAGCLKRTYSPAWFAMQIDNEGEFVIMLEHSNNQDIDFACWGPFKGKNKIDMLTNICQNPDLNFSNPYSITYNDPNPCHFDECNTATDQNECMKNLKTKRSKDLNDSCFRGYHDLYPYDMMVDCSYSQAATEACFIPNAKKGEWYILLITNYSKKQGDITFKKAQGSATTNCNIIVDASSTGPYCEGESISLTVNNAPTGASFIWRGPNDFSSNEQSPVIEDATPDMGGSYFIQMTSNGIKSAEVEVLVEVNKRYERDTTITIDAGDSFVFGDSTLIKNGIYSHNFLSSTGCDSIINLTLNLKYPIDVTTSNSGPYCEGDVIQLTNSDIPDGATLRWSGPNGFTSTENNPTISDAKPENSGEYKLQIFYKHYTYYATSTELIVNKKDKKDITLSVSFGDEVSFGNETITASKTGIHSKTFQNIFGCDSLVNLTLLVDTPMVTTANAGPYCQGETATLMATNVPSDASLSWRGPNGFSSTANTPTIASVKPEDSGTYELTITRNGVSFMAQSNKMTIHPTAVTDTTAIVMIGDDVPFGDETITASKTEIYTKTFPTGFGCDSLVHLTLVVDTPTVTIANAGPYCEDETASLSALNVPEDATLSWRGPNGFSSSIAAPTIVGVKPEDSGIYELTVTRNGVSFEATKTGLIVNKRYETDKSENVSIGDKYLFGDETLIASETKTITKTFLSSLGCDSVVNLTLLVDTPMVATSNAGPYCQGETATLMATYVPSDASLSWRGPNGFSSTANTPTIASVKPENSGTYELTITRNGVSFEAAKTKLIVNKRYEVDTTVTISAGDEITFGGESLTNSCSETKTFQTINGCDSIVTLHLNVIDVITRNSGPYCDGESIELSASGMPSGATLKWDGPAGFTSTDEAPTIHNATVENEGEYKVQVIIDGIPYRGKATTVIVHQKAQTDSTIIIYAGEEVTFDNDILTTSGDYTKTFSTTNGCDSIMTLHLTALDVRTSNSGPYCEGDNINLVAENIPENVTSIKWKGPKEFSSSKAEPTITNATTANAGIYSLSVFINGNVYKAPDTEVQVYPNVSSKIIQELAYGDHFQFGELLIDKAGKYEQTFTTIEGCDSTVHMTVKIVFPDSLSIIPAVLFTPNADGINDRWTITNIERFPDSQISIYNRNGKLIRKFKGYDNTQGWDGTDINGNNLPSTDYWYTINVPVIDKIYVGHFTLLR